MTLVCHNQGGLSLKATVELYPFGNELVICDFYSIDIKSCTWGHLNCLNWESWLELKGLCNWLVDLPNYSHNLFATMKVKWTRWDLGPLGDLIDFLRLIIRAISLIKIMGTFI